MEQAGKTSSNMRKKRGQKARVKIIPAFLAERITKMMERDLPICEAFKAKRDGYNPKEGLSSDGPGRPLFKWIGSVNFRKGIYRVHKDSSNSVRGAVVDRMNYVKMHHQFNVDAKTVEYWSGKDATVHMKHYQASLGPQFGAMMNSVFCAWAADE